MISLLLLTYNRRGMTMRCLQSLAPTLTARDDVEWVILDNASTDGTAAMLLNVMDRQPDKIRVILNSMNLGVSGGRARLLDEARGDTLVFLDSDVVAVDPDWLDRLIAPLCEPHIGLCGPGGHWITVDQRGRWQWFMPVADDYVGEVDVVSGYCQAFRRSVLDRGVHIDTSYGRYWHEDSQYCLDIKTLGLTIWCTGNIGLRHIFAGSGDDGTGHDKFQMLAARWAGKGLIRAEHQPTIVD